MLKGKLTAHVLILLLLQLKVLPNHLVLTGPPDSCFFAPASAAGLFHSALVYPIFRVNVNIKFYRIIARQHWP